MFAAQFIFKPGNYDEQFHRLDESIDAYALTLEGFLGVERWVSPEGETKNSIYYFEDMATITKFASFEDHREAKAKVQTGTTAIKFSLAKSSNLMVMARSKAF